MMPPKAEIRVVHTGQFSGTTPALIDGLVTVALERCVGDWQLHFVAESTVLHGREL